MTSRIRTDELKYYLIYGLLFLTAMNFQAKFFYFVFISSFVFFVLQGKCKINKSSLLYLFLAILMSLYNYSNGIMLMLKCFAPFLFYLLGYNLVTSKKVKTKHQHSILEFEEKHGYYILATISAGSFSHYMLNFIYNIDKFTGRNPIDIWSGQIMAATGQGALACIMIGFAISMIFSPMKKSQRIVGIFCITGTLLYNLVLACRTLIVITLALVVISCFYLYKNFRTLKEKTRLLFGAFVGIIFSIAIIFLNMDWFENTNLYNRFGESAESLFSLSNRLNTRFKFIKNFWEYPFGGSNLREKYGYAHDLILDGYDEYGIISLFILVAILINGIMGIYMFIKQTEHKNIKLYFLLVYVSILLIFFVEPILAGMPWLFSCYALINGCIAKMNQSFYG